jgi:hypothetical protein
MPAPSIYLSYPYRTAADLTPYNSGEELGRAVRDRLIAAGLDVFYDKDVPLGENWELRARRELADRTYFIVVLLPDTLRKAPGVRAELSSAIDQRKKIVPLMLRGFSIFHDVPDEFGELPSYKGIFSDVNRLDDAVREIAGLLTPSVQDLAGSSQPDKPVSPQSTLPNAASNKLTTSRQKQQSLLFSWLRRLNEPWAIIIAALIGGVFVIGAALVALQGNNNSQIASTNVAASATALALLVVPTNTTPPPVTDVVTQPSPTASETPPPPISPSQTPAPTLPTPTTPPPDTPSGSNQLTLIADQDSLTLYVPEQTDLTGLTFTNDLKRAYELSRLFTGLTLTNGIAEAGSCFRLTRSGSTPPLATVCQNRALLFTTPVGDSDVFWYDPLQANFRVVEVRRGETLIGRCTFAESDCSLRGSGR